MRNKFLPFLLLLAVLPVLIFRDYTPSNELRYLSIVDEAFRNGDFFTFTNHGLLYADKPPLYFWIVMLGKWLLGTHAMWFLSLFSFIPALVIMGVMDKWVGRELPDASRLSAQLMLMSSGFFLGMAVVLRMDMLMCMFIVLSLYTFYKMLRGQGSRRWNEFLFPFYVFMAVFSKGPVGILIPLVSTLVFLLITGRIKMAGTYWGWKTWGILLIGCTIWFGGVCLEEGGTEYLYNLLFHQTMGRAIDAFDHDNPFYYYLISVWYSLAPWSLLLIGVIIVAACRKLIRSDLERFFMVVIVTTFVMLSCFSAKLQIYLAPAFPFFVYLGMLLLTHFRWNRWLALSVAIPAAVFLLGAPAIIVLAQMEDTAFLGQPLFYVAASMLTVSGGVTYFFLYRKKSLHKAIDVMVIGLYVALFVGGWALPSINNELGYGVLCEKAMEVSAEKKISVYCVLDMSRPENMDVYLHKSVQIVSPEEVVDGKYKDAVLMVSNEMIESNKELREFVSGKEQTLVGRYSVIVL